MVQIIVGLVWSKFKKYLFFILFIKMEIELSRPDKLFYYSKSRDLAPGKGVNEYVEDPSQYKILSKVKDWRKILSNFYVSPFTWNGRTWNSVEHAFQGSKIALVDPEKGEWFTLESGHTIGQGNGEEARKNRKLVMLNQRKLKEWNEIKSNTMESILYEKFTQVPLAGRVLYETSDAELWHSPGRAKAERQWEMEKARDKLIMDTDMQTILSKMFRTTRYLENL
jgi:predicted NAD-dependent protein-ADP-ribosyltransferase YbiA (DUF1768 family)